MRREELEQRRDEGRAAVARDPTDATTQMKQGMSEYMLTAYSTVLSTQGDIIRADSVGSICSLEDCALTALTRTTFAPASGLVALLSTSTRSLCSSPRRIGGDTK